jgi:hypothetical protein
MFPLARWLIDQKAYDLAVRELTSLQRLFPDAPGLARLLRIARQQRQLDQQQSRETEPGPRRPAADEPATRQSDDRPDPIRNRLSEQQLNLIRVWETDPQARPRIRVPRQTINQLFEQYGDEEPMPSGPNAQRRVQALAGWQKLILMFRVQARDLYDQVEVLDEPAPLRAFRRSAHRRYVLGYCGTANCHGGQSRGGLYLFNRAIGTEQTLYTNFYILSQYANDAGRMIDREVPGRSLLLEYGLPRDQAETPHPATERWRPHFAEREGEQFLEIRDIIEALYDQPAYGIAYEPPGRQAPEATQPRGPKR